MHLDARKKIADLDAQSAMLEEEGHYSDTVKILKRAVEIAESNLEEEDEDRLRVRHLLGHAFLNNGQWMEAESVLENVVIIKRRTLEKDDPSLAATMYTLGRCYLYQSKLDEATIMLEECLEIRKKKLSASDLLLVKTMYLLGQCLMDQHKYSESEKMLRDALRMRSASASLPSHHKDIACSQYTLSRCLREQGKLAEAIQLATTCLGTFKQSFPPLHPHVASAVGHLGTCLMDTGRLEEAEGRFREALSIERKSLQEDHPNIAVSLHNLGHCLLRRRKGEEAQKFLREAVNIESFSLPQNHPDKIFTLTLWAQCFISICKYGAAERRLFEALRIINANHLPKNSSQRSNVMLLLHRLSPLQQSGSGVIVTPERETGQTGVCVGRSQASQGSKTLTNQQDPCPSPPSFSLENVHISEPSDPFWIGGTLELRYIGSRYGSSFHQTIDSEGGQLTAGGVSITVSPGAVSSPTQFSIESFIHNKWMPPVSGADMHVVSPVVFLHPHDVPFKKPVKVFLDTAADVKSPGWTFTLLRSEMARNAPSLQWRGVVVYSSSTQEIKSHIPFDGSSWTVEVKNFCWWVWVGRVLSNPSIVVRRKMGCMALGQCLSLHKWAVSVHMFNSYEGIDQEIMTSFVADSSLPVIPLCSVKEINVRKSGEVLIKPQPATWSLVNSVAECHLPCRLLWSEPFNADHCFTFLIESVSQDVDCLDFFINVEYSRRQEVQHQFTLRSIRRLTTADLSQGILPSISPSLSDQEPHGFLYAGPDGLHFSGRATTPPLASLPTATATNGSSSQRARIPPSGFRRFGRCAVSPLHSQTEEESQVTVRLPNGSEVFSAGCTFQYTGATGHPVGESHGERVDSRTVKTVILAWPHTDNVETVILTVDGETRLAYLVRDVIDVIKSAPATAVSGKGSLPSGKIKQATNKDPLRFKRDETALAIPSHITTLAQEICFFFFLFFVCCRLTYRCFQFCHRRFSSAHLGGFWEGWSDIPVDVVHQVCRLAADSTRSMELADCLHVSMMDISSKPKADTPALLVRQILHIWIHTKTKKATLDVLLRTLEQLKLLEALVAELKCSA